MLNFCTLFDTNYLARGLAMYESLSKVCSSFHLYVFAFDDECYTYLKQEELPYMTPVSLNEFENDALLGVKHSRSTAEYCWTSTPFTILYCLEKFSLPSCTYLDADMIFYSDPQVLVDEMGQKSVLISKHGYPRLYDQSWYSGIYCVQFMYFKNNADGLHVLNWWKDRCIEWCYARLEDGKFGDQKYLDDWPTRFSSVHVLQHPGGGLAPWNLIRYNVYKDGDLISISEKGKTGRHNVVFFHYHGVKFFADGKVSLAGPLYEITPWVKQVFYFQYIERLLAIASGIFLEGRLLDANGAKQSSPSRTNILTRFIKDRISAFSRQLPAAFHPKNYNFKNHYHLHNIILGKLSDMDH